MSSSFEEVSRASSTAVRRAWWPLLTFAMLVGAGVGAAYVLGLFVPLVVIDAVTLPQPPSQPIVLSAFALAIGLIIGLINGLASGLVAVLFRAASILLHAPSRSRPLVVGLGAGLGTVPGALIFGPPALSLTPLAAALIVGSLTALTVGVYASRLERLAVASPQD